MNNPVFASNTYCVDAAASSAGTGSCWTSPFKELSSALSAATTVGDQILVAKGTYKPTGSTRACSFLLNTNGIGVYGGYPSGGGIRDTVSNLTILSGDVGTVGDIADNCYHVLTIGTNVRLNAVLDGFTITSGNANGTNFPDYLGGGIVSKDGGTLTISNVTLSGNYALRGGGMYNQGSSPNLNTVVFSNNFATDAANGKAGGLYNYTNGSPILNNVSFLGNSSALDGGGMYNSTNSSPVLNNVIFQSNIATGSGAGIYNYSNSNMSLSNATFNGNTAHNHAGAIYNSTTSNTTIVNGTFSGNTASTGNGGAIYNDTGTHSLSNSTFTNNTASTGTALYNKSLSSFTITNSLFWGNATGMPIVNSGSTPVISYSVVQNSNGSGSSWVSSLGADTGHNLDSNPLLGVLGNYGGSTQTHPLLPNSAAIDAGNSCGSYDQRGLSRVGSCDIGAFESQGFTLTKTSGDAQSTIINTSFINPLVINLSSATGEPIIGGTVTFTDLGTTAKTTLSSAQQLSLSSNSASLAAPTANGIQGSYVVQASVRGANPVSFSLTNTAVPSLPTAPSSLVATAISATQINLMWVDNSSNETGFKLESPVGTALTTLAANTTTYSHTGLTCGTTYTYSLKATNVAGDSTAITATASTTACPVAIPTAPSSLVATAISATQINLTWVDNSSNETGFKLESPVGTALTTLAANTTVYNHMGLTCGTTYTYSLKATNMAGDSSAITATASTTACPVIIPDYNLGVISAGTGSGIISGTPAGSYPSGTSINLSALANTGSSFVGWSPSLCGTAFNLTANLNCTALFESLPPATYHLTLNSAGTGAGIISGTTAGNYLANTVINLTAMASTGSTFKGWSPSDCANFSLIQNTTCTAIFDNDATAASYNFSIQSLGNGKGIVGGTPAGKYVQNTPINLLAVADHDSEFLGWTPSNCATGFLLNADSTCVANFSLKSVASFNLVLNKTGAGTGTILGTATGIYPQNTPINLVAVADDSSKFVGWNPSSCEHSFYLLADTTCTANFMLKAAASYYLSIAQAGSGSGTVTGTAAGDYVKGSVISLLATANEDSLLTGWSPMNCGAAFTLDADTRCTAIFDKKPAAVQPTYNVTLLSSGVSNAILNATPAAPYAAGTQVKLSATAPNAEFLGWQGNGCDSNLTIDRNLICIANFQTLSAGRVRVVDSAGNLLTQLSEKKSASSVKVNVARVEGKTGAVSIRYQTQAGTALAGVDYQTLSGTLTWENADNSVKTIEIPLVPNSTYYGDNYFYLLLNTENEQLALDNSFIKVSLQEIITQPACNNALQLDMKGDLQANVSCFTHQVNHVETGKNRVAVSASDPVSIQSMIEINPQYLGQYGEVLMVAVYFPDSVTAPIALQRRGNTWLYWSGALEELSAITRYPSLPKQIALDVYNGTLSNALGRFEVYVGYRLADGRIIFNGLNVLKIEVSV